MSLSEEVADDVDEQAIEELVERFQNMSKYERNDKDEADVRQQFLNPLFRALGWDTTTDQVTPEQTTLVGDSDYAFILNNEEQFHVEAKPFREDLDDTRRVRGEEQSYAEQAIDYAHHQRCDWAILTNFEELRLYWTHVNKDNHDKGLVFKLSCDEFTAPHGLQRLSKLSKTAVQNGSLDRLERERERNPVTVEILNDLADARVDLTKDVYESHPSLDLDVIRDGVQRILDRIVVMRVAEDRGVIPAENLRKRMKTWQETTIDKEKQPLFADLISAFRGFHETYETELFAQHQCEDWYISNDVIEDVIRSLYEYNFDYISADILGSIYEDYLGHTIEERGEELELVTQEDVQREYGIYFTPYPVVRYLVDISLGQRLDSIMDEVHDHLEGENPDFEAAREAFDQIEDVKFLDVCSGSGTFLIAAYDLFEECYLEYKELINEAIKKADVSGITAFSGSQTIGNNYGRKILENNLYAVDMDQQAAEIAVVNLLLKALSKGEPLPDMLGENIKVGNSLLDGSREEVEEVLGTVGDTPERTPMNWEEEFADVFDDGGFSIIAGNPPWGADMETYRDWLEADDNYELADGQYNSYQMFLELGPKPLEEDGSLAYIIPDTILEGDDYEETRRWLLDNHQLRHVHKMGEGLFDNVYHPTSIVHYTNADPDLDAEAQAALLKKEDRKELMGARARSLDDIIQEKGSVKTQRRFIEDDDYELRLWAKEPDYEIIEQMESNTVDWSNVISNGRGDETGRDGNIMKCPNCLRWDSYPRKRADSKGGGYYDKTCTHCGHEYAFENAVSTRQIVSETKTEDCDRPIYFGEHVNRYRTSDCAYIDDSYADDLDMKDEWRFEAPKLLIRRSSFGFFATIDYSNARSLKANLVFRPLDDREEPYDRYDLEYFLAFLNSRAMLYYWSKVTNTVEWESHIRHTQTFIMDLPVPEVDWDDDDEVEQYEELVELIQEAAESDGQIDEELDWEIERRVMDFYGIGPNQKERIFSELEKVQRMRIVRELFPDKGDDEEEE